MFKSRVRIAEQQQGTLNMTDNLIINNANRGVYLGNKSARGTIANNVIIDNGTGIGGIAAEAGPDESGNI
jgi:parallel beta-helix repeat protein